MKYLIKYLKFTFILAGVMLAAFSLIAGVLLLIFIMSDTVKANNLSPNMVYQAVLRDRDGFIESGKTATVVLSIYDDDKIIFSERHVITSDSLGHVQLSLGAGELFSGNFESIKWGDNLFLGLNVDGNIYAPTPLLAVPKAWHSVISNTANKLAGKIFADTLSGENIFWSSKKIASLFDSVYTCNGITSDSLFIYGNLLDGLRAERLERINEDLRIWDSIAHHKDGQLMLGRILRDSVIAGEQLIIERLHDSIIASEQLIIERLHDSIIAGEQLIIERLRDSMIAGEQLIIERLRDSMIASEQLIIERLRDSMIASEQLIIERLHDSIIASEQSIIERLRDSIVVSEQLIIERLHDSIIASEQLIIERLHDSIIAGEQLIIERLYDSIIASEQLIIERLRDSMIVSEQLIIERLHDSIIASEQLIIERLHDSIIASEQLIIERLHDSIIVSEQSIVERLHDSIIVSEQSIVERLHDSIVASEHLIMERLYDSIFVVNNNTMQEIVNRQVADSNFLDSLRTERLERINEDLRIWDSIAQHKNEQSIIERLHDSIIANEQSIIERLHDSIIASEQSIIERLHDSIIANEQSIIERLHDSIITIEQSIMEHLHDSIFVVNNNILQEIIDMRIADSNLLDSLRAERLERINEDSSVRYDLTEAVMAVTPLQTYSGRFTIADVFNSKYATKAVRANPRKPFIDFTNGTAPFFNKIKNSAKTTSLYGKVIVSLGQDSKDDEGNYRILLPGSSINNNARLFFENVNLSNRGYMYDVFKQSSNIGYVVYEFFLYCDTSMSVPAVTFFRKGKTLETNLVGLCDKYKLTKRLPDDIWICAGTDTTNLMPEITPVMSGGGDFRYIWYNSETVKNGLYLKDELNNSSYRPAAKSDTLYLEAIGNNAMCLERDTIIINVERSVIPNKTNQQFLNNNLFVSQDGMESTAGSDGIISNTYCESYDRICLNLSTYDIPDINEFNNDNYFTFKWSDQPLSFTDIEQNRDCFWLGKDTLITFALSTPAKEHCPTATVIIDLKREKQMDIKTPNDTNICESDGTYIDLVPEFDGYTFITDPRSNLANTIYEVRDNGDGTYSDVAAIFKNGLGSDIVKITNTSKIYRLRYGFSGESGYCNSHDEKIVKINVTPKPILNLFVSDTVYTSDTFCIPPPLNNIEGHFSLIYGNNFYANNFGSLFFTVYSRPDNSTSDYSNVNTRIFGDTKDIQMLDIPVMIRNAPYFYYQRMKKFSIAVIGKGACAGIAKYSDTVTVIKKDTGFIYPEIQAPSISLNETYKEINCNNNESFTFTANGTETLPEGSVYLWFTPENSTSSGAYMFSDIMIKEIKDGTFKSHTIHVNSTSNTMYPSCGDMDLPQRYNYFCVFIPRGCGDTYVQFHYAVSVKGKRIME